MTTRNDPDYKDHVITKAVTRSRGVEVTFADGWSFLIPGTPPVIPRVGMTARLYGKGIGFAVRGLEVAGVEIYYRTEKEQVEYEETALYGADAAEWLARWDSGRSVWSIEMGGMGPGYEQAIQITTAEILRHMLSEKYDGSTWEDPEKWRADCDKIEVAAHSNEVISRLGLSGAQWGAAFNLALHLYRQGPSAVMKDEAVKDRRIQVQRTFPSSGG